MRMATANPGRRGAASRTLAESLRRAGAVMVLRDSHPVAAHYGSAAAELTVCVTHVGAAVRSDLEILELLGRPAWLGRALQDALGAPALAPGGASQAGGAWCCFAAPERALLVGSSHKLDRCKRLIQQQALRAGHAMQCVDRSATMTALTLVGPLAAALLSEAGLPAGLPVAGVRTSWSARAPAVVLRESSERYLLLVTDAAAACATLFEVGEPLGLSFVGLDALERLAVVRRVT